MRVPEPASGELRARIEALLPYFYSPYDFGNGLVTRHPRTRWRFQRRLKLLRIPEDLTGKSVLDIGAYDGFFSFEFERRNARRVLAIDTYSWDHQRGLDCFLAARDYFGSKVEYRRLDVSELDPAVVGEFDLVFCAGVLYHLEQPLHDLKRIRSVTRHQLILETDSLIPAVHEALPLITLFAGDAGDRELPTQHKFEIGALPTRAWVSKALMLAGFDRQELVCTPSFRWMKKLAALATNRPQHGRLIFHAFVEPGQRTAS
jgi:tRNA (mo5U34)-methyltransferase